jgi:hypothetical protein
MQSVLSPLDSGVTFAPLFITPLPSVGIAPPSARFGIAFNVAPAPLAAAAPVIAACCDLDETP